MLVNRDGKIYQERGDIENIDDGYILTKSYMVRLINKSDFSKRVVAEEKFINAPTNIQIMWCLSKHKDANFAVVEEIFELEDTLPFR